MTDHTVLDQHFGNGCVHLCTRCGWGAGVVPDDALPWLPAVQRVPARSAPAPQVVTGALFAYWLAALSGDEAGRAGSLPTLLAAPELALRLSAGVLEQMYDATALAHPRGPARDRAQARRTARRRRGRQSPAAGRPSRKADVPSCLSWRAVFGWLWRGRSPAPARAGADRRCEHGCLFAGTAPAGQPERRLPTPLGDGGRGLLDTGVVTQEALDLVACVLGGASAEETEERLAALLARPGPALRALTTVLLSVARDGALADVRHMCAMHQLRRLDDPAS